MRPEYGEIVQFWGAANLLPVARNALPDLAVPPGAAEFLSEVGLIRDSELLRQSLGVSFDGIVDGKIVSLESVFGPKLADNDISPSMQSWLLLGHCFEDLVCLATENGSVVILEGDADAGFMDWFVNSSLLSFVRSLTLAMKSFHQDGTRSDVTRPVQALTVAISEIDPIACAKSTHWWPRVLDDIRSI